MALTSVVQELEPPDPDHLGVEEPDPEDQREADEEADNDQGVGQRHAVVVRGHSRGLVLAVGPENQDSASSATYSLHAAHGIRGSSG